MDLGIVGLDFQSLPVLGNGFGEPSAAKQGIAKVVVGLGEVGFDFQGPLILGHGLVEPSPATEGNAKVIVGQLVVGLEFQRLPVLDDSLVDTPAVGQQHAQVVMRQPAIRIAVNSRSIKRFDVGVHPALTEGQAGQDRQQPHAQHVAARPTPNPPSLERPHRAGRGEDNQAQAR